MESPYAYAATQALGVTATHTADVDVAELVTYARSYLGEHGGRSWRVVWVKRKLEKWLFELEASGEAGETRIIGKFHKGGRGQAHFEALRLLYDSGFRRPASFAVCRPVAYLPERRLLLQEKAHGRLMNEFIFTAGNGAAAALSGGARWLAALHETDLPAESRVDEVKGGMIRFGRQLAEALPRQAWRVERLIACALEGLQPGRLTPLVPSHGDFHPKNVLITDTGQVTAIDLDTFGRQERAADVGYFLAQTAIRGYHRHGTLEATASARRCFLDAYRDAAPLPAQRLGHYIGVSFLQSLHYDVCVLGNGGTRRVDPWLTISESCLIDGAPTLTE